MKRITLFLAFIAFVGVQLLHAQGSKITGTVTSADDGSPIPGVTVVVNNNQTIGTTTNLDGKYELNVPSDADALLFSFVGMKAVTEPINGRTVINVAMESEALEMEEVVVTALGISREKKALGYAVSEVSGDELAEAKESNIVSSLSGKVAGVQITQSSGAVGSSSRMTIRGNTSLNKNNQPLFVVDGVPISNFATGVSQWGGQDFGNAAADIDPSTVESVTVLKGGSAAALYGSRAANGVVLITTKKGAKQGKAGKGIGVSISSSTTFANAYIIPNYQNKYGQGLNGSEAIYNYRIDNGLIPSMTYQEYAENYAFAYQDGNWGGVYDGIDESWGPRLDIGLMLPQFDSPYTVAADGTVTYQATPWVSQPDNVKDIFETGITYDNNVTLTGGNDVAYAMLSLTNRSETGTIPNTDQTKNNVTFSGTVNLTDKFKFNAVANYVKVHSDNLPGGGYDENNIMQSVGGWFGRQVNTENLEKYWDTLDPYGNPYNWNRSYHNNPYWTLYNNTTSRDRDRLFGNFNLTYQLTDWLSVMGRVGTDYFTEYRKHVVYDKSLESTLGGAFWQNERTQQETNVDLIFSYNYTFGDKIGLSGTLGANWMNRKYDYMLLQAYELTVPNLFTIGNVNGDPNTGMYESEQESNSIFGSVNLSYGNFVYFDFTARNDWSSTLPVESNSYFYPSVSLGLIINEMIELPSNIISFAKIRGNYAQTGAATGPYVTQATYGSSAPFGGITGYSYSNTVPPLDLQNELTTSIEAGIDLRFLNNRVGFDFTWYKNNTENQILYIDVATSSGYTSQVINAGDVQNSGIELMLDGDIVKAASGLTWNIALNYAQNENIINELYGDIEAYQISSSWGGLTIEARPGEEYGQIVGGGFTFDDEGHLLVNSSGRVIKTSPQVIGNITPDWVGGLRSTLNWKGITFSFLIDARWGGDVYSVSDWFGAYAGISEETAAGDIRENGMVIGEDVLNEYEVWIDSDGDGQGDAVNDVNIFPQTYFADYWGNQEISIIDGSFIKLREVVLSYELPSSMLSNIGFIKGANIAFVGRNLALLYTDESNDIGIDPETGFGIGNAGVGLEQFQLPSTRTLGFKIGLKF